MRGVSSIVRRKNESCLRQIHLSRYALHDRFIKLGCIHKHSQRVSLQSFCSKDVYDSIVKQGSPFVFLSVLVCLLTRELGNEVDA